MKIEFTSFVISEMVYRIVANGDEDFDTGVEEVEHKAQGRLAVHKELESCIFDFVTDLKSTIDDEPFRTLELTVQFHFSLDDLDNEEWKENSEEKDLIVQKIRDKFSGEVLNFCKVQVATIIRQFTSIDFYPTLQSGDYFFSVE